MTDMSSAAGFNVLAMNQSLEVHPNLPYFMRVMGVTDYQTNTLPIQNVACGCDKPRYEYRDAHSWNTDYQMGGPHQSTCPAVMYAGQQPGDNGLSTRCFGYRV